MTSTTSGGSRQQRTIAILNDEVALPAFNLFEPVIISRKEIATVIGIFYDTNIWLYRLDGLREMTRVWWQAEQLRSLRRR
jgi:hypothetical protein